MLLRLCAFFAISLVAASAILVFFKLPRPTFEKKAFESMNIGAAIYAGTFAFLHNFDYRLIFLLLLVPQLLYWMKRKDPWRHIAVLCTAAIAIALYVSAENRYWRTILIKESVEWFLFGCCLLLLLEMLPNWVGRIIGVQRIRLKNNQSVCD